MRRERSFNLRIESIKADSGRACRLKPGLATEYLGMLPKINTSLKKNATFGKQQTQIVISHAQSKI
jgi:hypothetical protein